MKKSKLLKNDKIEEREYQKRIAETAAQKNTLVVLPTGMGKTLIAVIVAMQRLKKYPDSKIMITSPTRPLNAQHKKSFERFTDIDAKDIILITGKINPNERAELYKRAKVIAATPQCIRNDLKNKRLSLEGFSFVVFDEAHRAVKEYAYTYIAKKYMLQSKHPLILGLTASPGATYERIDDICSNLFIKTVEIRSELDKDVERYVQPIKREWIYVEFPEQFQRIKALLEEVLKENLYWLKEKHYLPSYKVSKKMLINLQTRIGSRYARGSKSYGVIWAMIRSAEAIKIEHAIELLETQGIPFLHDYFEKMQLSKKKTDKRLLKRPEVQEAIKIIGELHAEGVEHPKLDKVKHIVKDLVAENPKVKIIIFANYRATVERIKELLTQNRIKSEILIGQAMKEDGMGLTQQEQIEILKRFRSGEFATLIGTSVSEEGLSIPDVDYVIFYEAVASEIRAIQRRGRTGRTSPGKVIFLITKGTRDESYYWSAFHKEKRMKRILYDMKKKGKGKKKETLIDFIKR